MSKILFASHDLKANLNSPPNRLFSLSKSFLILDSDDLDFRVLENVYFDTKKCEFLEDMMNLEVKTIVIDTICNPCFEIFKDYFTFYEDKHSLTIRESYQRYIEGALNIKTESSHCICQNHLETKERKDKQLERFQ
ncbi:MAG: hypothetical protein INQ03_19625 [Candidatus Heimdallarchaeota archaeon]|nr:hypothetical protein [Candidatus Heimdallarchaeota archaeon]